MVLLQKQSKLTINFTIACELTQLYGARKYQARFHNEIVVCKIKTKQVSTVEHTMNGGTKGELFKDQPAGPCTRFLAPEPDSGEEGERAGRGP